MINGFPEGLVCVLLDCCADWSKDGSVKSKSTSGIPGKSAESSSGESSTFSTALTDLDWVVFLEGKCALALACVV